MPIIKSAKKRMRQNIKRRARNFPIRSELKTTYKKALELINDGKIEEAQKFMSFAYSIIDTAVKKKVLHKNTAARRKSNIAKALNDAQGGKGAEAPKEEEKAEVKKKK